MSKLGPVTIWLMTRAFIQELQEEDTPKKSTKQRIRKKSVKRKKRRTTK